MSQMTRLATINRGRVRFVRGQDQAKPASLGTGVTQTQLNGSSPLTAPAEARNLIGVLCGLAPNAALTAAETMFTKYEATSKAVNLTPKAIVAGAIHGGLGTFAGALIPALHVFPWNVPLVGGEDISYFGTPMVANTAAPDGWMDILYSNYEPDPIKEAHVYWDGPTDETSSGTAAADGVVGGTFTVASQKRAILRYLYTVFGTGTVTASESTIATARIDGDIDTAMPVVGTLQPIAAALGTAVEQLQANILVHEEWIPLKGGNAKVRTLLDLQEARTAAGNWYTGTGYLLDPRIPF